MGAFGATWALRTMSGSRQTHAHADKPASFRKNAVSSICSEQDDYASGFSW